MDPQGKGKPTWGNGSTTSWSPPFHYLARMKDKESTNISNGLIEAQD
jgi:hypothetical protein